jgi:hypothetical protein
MVLRRSTTDWTWLRLLRSVARSIVAFILPSLPRSTLAALMARAGYSER